MNSARIPLLAGLLLLVIASCRGSDNKSNPTTTSAAPPPAPVPRDAKTIVRDPFPTRGLIHGLAYTPDGKRLISASASDVRVFDAMTGALLGLVGTVQSPVARSAVSADGRLAAIAMSDKISVFDVDSKSVQRSVPLPPRLTSLAIATNGTVAIGDPDGNVTVFTKADAAGKSIKGTGSHQDLVFDREGKRLVARGLKEIDLIDVTTNQKVRSFGANGDPLMGAMFSNDGKRLAYGSKNGSVSVVAVEDGRAIAGASVGAQAACALAFSPDGKRLGVGQCDQGRAGFIEFLSEGPPPPETMKREWFTRAFATQVQRAVFSPTGSEVAVYGDAIVILSAQTGAQLVPFAGHAAPVKQLLFTRDGESYLTTSDDGMLRVVVTQTGVEKKTFDTKLPARAIALGAGDVVLAAVDQKILRLNTGTGAEAEAFTKHKGAVHAIATSADGKIAVSTEKSDGYRMRVWKTEDNTEIRELKLDALKHVTSATIPCTISPDGKTAIAVVPASATVEWDASGAPKGNSALLAFDVATGKAEAPWTMPKWITSVAFSPTGKELAVAGVDGVTLYEWPKKTVVSTPTKTFTSAVSFSGDGSLISGLEMQKPTVWDAKKGEVRWTAKEPGLAVLSPDGKTLAKIEGRGIELGPLTP